MTEEKGYNGWSNYATWLVNVHLSNDEGTYSYVNELAQTSIDNAEADKYNTKKEDATQALADSIKGMIDEGNPLADKSNLYSDMLQAIIDEADYYAIAEAWLEDFDIPEDTEEEEAEEDETEIIPNT